MDVDVQEIFSLSHSDLLLIDDSNEVFMLFLDILADLSLKKSINVSLCVFLVH